MRGTPQLWQHAASLCSSRQDLSQGEAFGTCRGRHDYCWEIPSLKGPSAAIVVSPYKRRGECRAGNSLTSGVKSPQDKNTPNLLPVPDPQPHSLFSPISISVPFSSHACPPPFYAPSIFTLSCSPSVLILQALVLPPTPESFWGMSFLLLSPWSGTPTSPLPGT